MIQKDNSKLYIRILLIFIAAVLVTVTAILFIIPAIYENNCITRVYEDLEERMDSSVLSANICIVRHEETTHGNVTEYSYSLGASGVIFDKKLGIYYALTANHVVEEKDSSVKSSFIVQPYGTSPYSTSSDNHSSLREYYSKFPTAKVEYTDVKNDLAVISFYTSEDLQVLPLAESDALSGERIAVVSNPDGERFVHSFGNILSDEQIVFSADDDKSYNMAIQHNAYTAPGSSGSAVLNENMEIVGINIGGASNFMGRYRYSAMIPSRQVRRFLDNWRNMQDYDKGNNRKRP